MGLNKKDFTFLLSSFLLWRVGLLFIAFLATKLVTLQSNFLGGGFGSYISAPLFWGWANFDGEHYLSIAQSGYGHGEQAFFPLFPLVIKCLGQVVNGSLFNLNLIGLLVSNLSFLVALIGFFRLLRLDFSEKTTKAVLILLFLFPTSFYFGSLYTEGLFLALVIWSFYFARSNRWLLASLLGLLASATRVIGIILFPVLLVEFILQNRNKKNQSKILSPLCLVLIPLGLTIYMFYLKSTTGDFLAFISSLPSFGEQRSAAPVLLPQIFYRYFFKILPNLNYTYFPQVFTTFLELVLSLLFGVAATISLFKLKLSYALYLVGAYLLSTISGSFSSFPRYALVLFPVFILFGVWLVEKPRAIRIVFYALSFSLLVISLAMFFRGYWLA